MTTPTCSPAKKQWIKPEITGISPFREAEAILNRNFDS